MAGVSKGPIPWWQAPGNTGTLQNLQQSAPAGYEYDPIKMTYSRTPTSAGERAADFTNAATGGVIPGSLSGLLSGGPGGMDNNGMVTTSVKTSGGVGGTVFGSGGDGTGGGTGSGGSVGHIAPPDMSASNSAIFARAKDQAGQIARASLNALMGEYGAQGMLGGGAAAQGIRDIVSKGMGEVGDVNRELAVQNASQAADFAKLGYTGDITQRGQDIQHEEAQASLALAQQDRYMKMLSLLLQSVGSAPNSLIY